MSYRWLYRLLSPPSLVYSPSRRRNIVGREPGAVWARAIPLVVLSRNLLFNVSRTFKEHKEGDLGMIYLKVIG